MASEYIQKYSPHIVIMKIGFTNINLSIENSPEGEHIRNSTPYTLFANGNPEGYHPLANYGL